MSTKSKENVYFRVIEEAKEYTYLWLMGEIFNPHGFELLTLIGEAKDTGLTQAEIGAAITIGKDRGRQKEYWAAVSQEAEEFWARRYDPDAAEDW